MTYVFPEPVRMLVLHPQYGRVEVKAFCPFDARMQAAAIWKVSIRELQRAQIGIDKEVLPERE